MNRSQTQTTIDEQYEATKSLVETRYCIAENLEFCADETKVGTGNAGLISSLRHLDRMVERARDDGNTEQERECMAEFIVQADNLGGE